MHGFQAFRRRLNPNSKIDDRNEIIEREPREDSTWSFFIGASKHDIAIAQRPCGLRIGDVAISANCRTKAYARR